MTRRETPFVTDRELILVEAFLTGPLGTVAGRFVLDTGAVLTTMTHELAGSIGYSARDGVRRARVRTAIGSEEGYLLNVAEFDVLGYAMPNFPVHVFDLGHDDMPLPGFAYASISFTRSARARSRGIAADEDLCRSPPRRETPRHVCHALDHDRTTARPHDRRLVVRRTRPSPPWVAVTRWMAISPPDRCFEVADSFDR
jgi:hypothetical protein